MVTVLRRGEDSLPCREAGLTKRVRDRLLRAQRAALDPARLERLVSEGGSHAVNGAIVVGTVEGQDRRTDRLAERFRGAEQVRGALVLTRARRDLRQRLDAAREKPFAEIIAEMMAEAREILREELAATSARD